MAIASELPINTTASAKDMAEAMFGNGIKIIDASYTGAASASGIYSDADATIPGVAPSDTGVILSTGKAEDITNSSGDANSASDTSTDHGLAGDSDLNEIAGSKTYDAAVFEAKFIPEGETLTMQITFSSEEYLEYVNAGFNDAVGVFVNGVKAELAIGDGDITINNINTGSNENLYLDNPANTDPFNTEMDGLTVTLTLKAPVEAGAENTIKIAIADGGDGIYDSNLLIAGDSIQTALIAEDDDFEIVGNTTETFDVLDNDATSAGGTLTITAINGQPVKAGQSVELPTGEIITLNDDGTLSIKATDEAGTDVFSYLVEDENGNTDTAFVNLTTTAPCFTRGTMIATMRGEIPVEALKPGDAVFTRDNGMQVLRWTGQSVRPREGANAPVRIAANSLGHEHPSLEVSQQHRLLIQNPEAELYFGTSEVLVKAKDLLGRPGVTLAEGPGDVCYLHLLFDRHEVILADGVFSESYHPGQQTLNSFDAGTREEVLRLFPDCDPATGTGYGPTARPVLRSFEASLVA
ncbi:choice-of-anchor L domain-containing protein [Shimia ponticola]|uniref:choice-of-anchor L domain-containing protein n=1 Tax=Shimia ponticola TaxID=2582893 RepID=UPI0011BF77E6|nr:choice-of-anchor L domain-containing protein [Shimia ponticola]